MVKKLRIGVVLQGSATWVGGAEYFRNLIQALYRLPADRQNQFELAILSEGPLDRRLFADMPPRFWHELHENLGTTRQPLWLRVGHRLAPARFPGGSPLVRHAWRLGVRFLYPLNRPAEDYGFIPSASWIPDFQHRELPDLFSDDEKRCRDEAYSEYLGHAPAVFLSSDHVACELERFCPTAVPKVRLLRFCTVADENWHEPDAAVVARKHGLDERFFIVCNQFWKHKNHALLFAALAVLRERGIAAHVVCTGKVEDYRHPEYAGEVRRQIEDAGIAAQVHLLGLLPRGEQVQLMRRAIAVVQPSLCEGWSTVVEDCRALGKRVALSDIPVHREQDPPGATYFSPHDLESLAQILADWWRHLPAGPDCDSEQQALARNRAAVEAFGERFLAHALAIAA